MGQGEYEEWMFGIVANIEIFMVLLFTLKQKHLFIKSFL